MRIPDSGYLSSILTTAESPCISIYLPTHRANGNGNGSLTDTQNRARFRSLVDRAGEILAKSHSGTVARGLTERLHKFRTDDIYWNRVLDSTVVLASPDRFDIFNLPRPVPEVVVVGDSFHVKPLLRVVQSAEPFHVLGLSRDRVALFAGNRYELQPLKDAGVPLTLTEVLGTEIDEPQPQYHTAGPSRASGPGAPGRGAMIAHGHAARKDEILSDMHRFFRGVDREVLARVSEPTGLPLIPMGIDDNVAEFRAVSKNRFVTPESVLGDWTNWSLHEIREKAWKVFEKHYLERLAKIREDFGTAAARGQGSDDLATAAKAAMTGRVGILLIDADRRVPGTIDMNTGELHPNATTDTNGDMLDDLAEIGLRTKAEVIVTPSAQMPTKTGLAAIMRY